MKARSFTHYLGTGMLAIGATFVQASFVNAAHAGEEPVTGSRLIATAKARCVTGRTLQELLLLGRERPQH